MAEIGFYHLLSMPLERALPRLLERAVGQGHRVVTLPSRSRSAVVEPPNSDFVSDIVQPKGPGFGWVVRRQKRGITGAVQAMEKDDVLHHATEVSVWFDNSYQEARSNHLIRRDTQGSP